MHGFAFGSEPRSSNPCVAHAGPEEQLQNLMDAFLVWGRLGTSTTSNIGKKARETLVDDYIRPGPLGPRSGSWTLRKKQLLGAISIDTPSLEGPGS